MSTEAPRRILITRLSAIGDGIHTMPVLCALRREFPQATLGWVAEPGAAQLLRGHECLDELMVVPKGWLKSPSEVLKLRRQLRSLEFDTVIDPQSLTKSAMAGFLSGARERIGFARPCGREMAPLLNNRRFVRTADHVVPGYLQLLEPLGITSPDVEFRVPREERAEEMAIQFVRESGVEGGFAVLNPGAGWESKRWPQARYAEVAQHLWRSHGVRSVVVWAGDQERIWAEEILVGSDGCSTLALDTRMPDLAALLRRSCLFVGSDTGPLHLAAATGTPCVGLYGPTLPEICGPFGPQHEVVRAPGASGSRGMRREGNELMQQITVESVVATCDTVLQKTLARSG